MLRSVPPARLLLAAALALPSAAAIAQQRPQTMPTRDVDVTYQMTVKGPDGAVKALTQRTRWDTKEQTLRVDPPAPGIYTVMDYRQHKLLAVRDFDHTMMIMPTRADSYAPGLSASASFQRVGTDAVAGLPCTDWLTKDSMGHEVTVCLTDDGVLLRVKAGGAVVVQATQVTYAPADPALFAAPAGYRQVQPQP